MFKNLTKPIKNQQISLKNWKEQIFNKGKKGGRPDYVLLTVVVLLVVLGILILASVSAPVSQDRFGVTYHFLSRHFFWLIIGIILAFLTFRINLNFLKKIAPILLLINLILLAMVFLPGIGLEISGARRWINIGLISFQPSEFLKLTFILYLAAWLSVRTEKNNNSKEFKNASFCKTKTKRKDEHRVFIDISQTFIAFLAVVGLISLFLIFQPDISTLGVIVLVACLMYFSAKTPFWHNVLIVLIGSGSLFALIKLAPYRLDRLLVFLEPGLDPMGIGFQIKQSLIAIGSGGILGTGLGMGIQKFGFLPGAVSDSIFALFAEETGFVGGLILIFLFLIFLWQGFKISKLSQDKFSQLVALGITAWIVIQGFVNIGSMIGLLPLTGIPLPFISFGGSSLIATLAAVGILLNISRQT